MTGIIQTILGLGTLGAIGILLTTIGVLIMIFKWGIKALENSKKG
jgi:hypothetical protein